jgi:glyoxylase-like metal-dependent hydrolase (beta-lactamase superfamily II)
VGERVFFRQIQRHGDNFSYVVADEQARVAAVVDPSFNAGEVARVVRGERFSLRYIINTHGHFDHVAGNEELKLKFGAKTVAHRLSPLNVDIKVDDGDVLCVGKVEVAVIHTPGHTPDSVCLLVEKTRLLTGDTLFVGECGRTDLAGGDARSLYDSLFNKLLRLDDAVQVYPGHDYGAKPDSTIGEERRFNYTLQPRSVEEFVEFMRQP